MRFWVIIHVQGSLLVLRTCLLVLREAVLTQCEKGNPEAFCIESSKEYVFEYKSKDRQG